MEKILQYIINMTPYMLISIPMIVGIRIIFHFKKKIKINWYHEIALFLFILFIVGLASQTVIPKFDIGVNGLIVAKNGIGGINLIPFKVLFDTYIEVFNNGNFSYFIINFLGNVIMFMPIGFFIPLLWNIKNKKVIWIGFCFSLFVELSQLFLARGTDIDDLILNTLGVYIGLLLYELLYSKFKIIKKFRQ